jgi:beta-lactamase class A
MVMKRGRFLGALGAALLVPKLAAARTIDVEHVIAQIPGIAGVYARTLAPGPPLVSMRAGEPFAAASIIKLAIMLTVYRAFDAGTARPSQTVRLRASDLIGGSPTLAYARPGETYTLAALLRAMIQQSDNSASNTLISAFGFDAINQTARHAGMTGTRLGRHFAGWVPADYISRNVTTPRDIGTLLYQIERGSREGMATVASYRSCRAMIDTLLGQEDRTKIARGLPPGTPCANKTGEIDGVRNDGAIVDPYGDDPYILVVLTRELTDTSAGNRGIAAIARRINAAVVNTNA